MTITETPTLAELQDRARRMREGGATIALIAERLGRSRTTVSSWLDPDHKAKQDRRRASYAGTCVECGAKTTGCNGASKAPKICAACASRLTHEQRHWTPERIIEQIGRFANEHGRVPVATDWMGRGMGSAGNGYPPVNVVQREFGSWADAVAAAGYERPKVGVYERTEEWRKNHADRHRIPLHELILRLQKASVDGVAPSTDDFNGYDSCRKRGMQWTELCALAGVKPRGRGGPRRRYSTDQLIQQIRDLSQGGYAPSTHDERNLYAKLRNRSISWSRACEMADVLPARRANRRWRR